jgi:hypothetical protein
MTPSDFSPQKILTPRRKRSFLSFRRKTDLVWFLLTLVLFSGGVTAFVFSALFLRRVQTPQPLPTLPPTAPLLSEPVVVTPPLPVSEQKQIKTPPSQRKKSVAPLPQKPKRSVSPQRSPRDPHYVLLRKARSINKDTDRTAKLSVKTTKSVGEPALELVYDLSQGEWVQAAVNIRADLSNFSRVQFLFRGEGASNTFEFKVVDSDGTNVGTSWVHQSATSAWTVVDVALSDLPYLWGGDSTLDWTRVRHIYFAVSKKKDDAGGRGRVLVRGIQFS